MELLKGFACPIPFFNGADFAGRGRVISGRMANRLGFLDLERTQNYREELLVLYFRRMMIYKYSIR